MYLKKVIHKTSSWCWTTVNCCVIVSKEKKAVLFSRTQRSVPIFVLFIPCGTTPRVREFMTFKPNGELFPEGGGDNIPLIRETLTLGRRESCDICLRYPNVSGLHCELFFRDGFWWIRDLGSTNGVKVNGVRVPKKLLHPGEKITIAKKSFTIDYQPPVGKRAMEEMLEDMDDEDILSQPLLERAGLEKPGSSKAKRPPQPRNIDPSKYSLGNDEDEDDEDE